MKKDNYNEDLDFIKSRADKNINRPESLSRESIEKLIENKKQKKNNRAVIRRFISLAAAACIMISSLFILDRAVFVPPKVSQETENTLTYEEITKAVKDYQKKRKLSSDLTILNGFAEDERADSAAGGSHSETNLRTEGILQPDVFLTDGEYLYYTENATIFIVKAGKDGQMTKTYEIKLAGSTENHDIFFHGIMLYENYLIADISTYYYYDLVSAKSGVQIYDISDKSRPVLVKEIITDGDNLSSRINGDRLYTVTRKFISETAVGNDLLPGIYNGDEKTLIPEKNISVIAPDAPESYITLTETDLKDLNAEPLTLSVLGRAGSEIYCTAESLYITASVTDGIPRDMAMRTNFRGGKTEITAFSLKDGIKYRAKTTLTGAMLNDYSIDEYKGTLRTALTTKEGADLIIMDMSLNKISEIKNFQKDEDIKAVRFMGDKAYAVTFENTDPLFIFDLEDPKKPVKTGELKIPGYSAYLHPVGENLLVGIGYDGDSEGINSNGKISLFDVSDPAEPTEKDSFIIYNSYIISEPEAYTAVTESSFTVPYSANDSKNENDMWRTKTGSLYMEIKDGKLNLNSESAFYAQTTAFRSAFIDEVIYTYCPTSGVASSDMKTGEILSFIETGRIDSSPAFTVS